MLFWRSFSCGGIWRCVRGPRVGLSETKSGIELTAVFSSPRAHPRCFWKHSSCAQIIILDELLVAENEKVMLGTTPHTGHFGDMLFFKFRVFKIPEGFHAGGQNPTRPSLLTTMGCYVRTSHWSQLVPDGPTHGVLGTSPKCLSCTPLMV